MGPISEIYSQFNEEFFLVEFQIVFKISNFNILM